MRSKIAAYLVAMALPIMLAIGPAAGQADPHAGHAPAPAPKASAPPPKPRPTRPAVKRSPTPQPRRPAAKPSPAPRRSPATPTQHHPQPSASAGPMDHPMPSGSPMPHPMPSGSPMEHTMPMPSASPMPHDQMNMPGHEGMTEMGVLMDPKLQGSGTAWVPATSPMRMWMVPLGDWHLMLHGRADLARDVQAGPRGSTAILSQNWAMAMLGRELGPGTLQFRAMLSAEPWTLPAAGMPQLLQSGETFQGRQLIDRQHAHDLFMELSARYTLRLSDQVSLFGYVGYPGEPALGPVAFMHRPTVGENSWAPLAHHHQDSTHITFGVATLGAMWGPLQVGGSIFNGREPDENRTDFDSGSWDSYSGRVTVNPLDTLSLSASYGFLRSPEASHPGEDIQRVVASALWSQPVPLGDVSLGFIWGANFDPLGVQRASHAFTLEAAARLAHVVHFYGRAEWVDQEGLDLANPDDLHRVAGFTLGAMREVYADDKISIGVGGDVTLSQPGRDLARFYGGDNPLSFHFFLRIAPPLMGHDDRRQMEHAP